MGNLLGATQSISTTATPLRQTPEPSFHLVIRAGLYNAGLVWVGNSATNIVGYLAPGDSMPFYSTSPHLIYVWGAAGDHIYWHGDGK